jgi:hypothetical protein
MQLNLFVIVYAPRGIQFHAFVIAYTAMVIQLNLLVIVYAPRGIQAVFPWVYGQ